MVPCAAGSNPGAAASGSRGRASATDLPEIVWTDEAVEHLEAIATYISVYDPAAAGRPAQRLIELADSLGEFPQRGRDAGQGRRELTVVRPYIPRYRVEGETVFILRIRHGARED